MSFTPDIIDVTNIFKPFTIFGESTGIRPIQLTVSPSIIFQSCIVDRPLEFEIRTNS